jgi:predicted RNA-binding protein Jag
MTEKEQAIQKYMKNLGLTRAEAEEMWQDEQDDNLPDLTPEQAKVAKAMARADRKEETKKRGNPHKPNPVKRSLIQNLADFLGTFGTEINVTNLEREIEFRYDGIKYRVTLMVPREKK